MIRKPLGSGRKPAWSRQADDYEALLHRAAHHFATFYCPEPRLRFGSGRFSPNPKRGLEDFGPLNELRAKRSIRLGAVGPPGSVDTFKTYLTGLAGRIQPGLNSRDKHFDPLVFPDFPGVSATSTFRTPISLDSSHERIIPTRFLEQDLKSASAAKRIEQIVARIGEQLDALAELDPQPDVVAVLMPPDVQDCCQHVGDEMRRRPTAALTPTEAFAKKMGGQQERSGQSFFEFAFSGSEPDEGNGGFWNFHHALKARAMRSGIPTQLIWERSLRGEQTTQDAASIAWNLVTGIYYKGGNIPWDVEGLPEDTCFLGIAFFKAGLHRDADTYTSLAQVFSRHGDGLVLKGGKAIKEAWKPAHIDQAGAEKLVRDALELYGRHHPGGTARRLVVHKTSGFWPDEVRGITAALPTNMRYDLVAVNTESDFRFMRTGSHPPLRGTAIKLSERETALYTVGYLPEFRGYPGAKIPRPIILTHEQGDSTRETICSEIMGLTKLNWNSCTYASKEPITTLFASSVGSILAEYLALPAESRGELQTKYRFYM